MAPSTLWTFAHRALSPMFHQDPARFLTRLDGNAAPAFLEQMWTWSLSTTGATAPARPPLSYGIQKLGNGSLVYMSFREVTKTGEPWSIRFVVKDGAYARMFLLEHSEYATELGGAPTAIVCESEQGGKHRNWGATFAPTDEEGFERFVFDTLRAAATARNN
ncbi:MAG TPA: hypothetical protein VFQ53_08440 [Kofleriaceae bacterium]|nr:hypothetical protein [Kofleriaceae bacterium]